MVPHGSNTIYSVNICYQGPACPAIAKAGFVSLRLVAVTNEVIRRLSMSGYHICCCWKYVFTLYLYFCRCFDIHRLESIFKMLLQTIIFKGWSCVFWGITKWRILKIKLHNKVTLALSFPSCHEMKENIINLPLGILNCNCQTINLHDKHS